MPDRHKDSIVRGDTYQQIIVTLAGKGRFEDSVIALRKILEEMNVEHAIIAVVEPLRATLVELGPGENVAEVSQALIKEGVALAAEQNRPLQASAIVNDPGYPEQWALGKIGAPSAWLRVRDIGISGPGVVVAIADTGIDAQHPDLTGALWDDGTGHHGWNFIDMNNDVYDAHGHGTELAGTIGAKSNNAIGIAGAEWPLRIMAVKFIDVRNRPTAWTGGAAIVWAVLRGAQVINTAWGVGIPYFYLRSAIQFANAFQVLVVAAAGNDGLDNDVLSTYPASYLAGPPDYCPNLISVMASDRDDDKAWFSNYGLKRVHLGAPGIRMLTTASSFAPPPRWREYSGTSAACALVTYAAVLIKSLMPSWTPTEIRDHLIASAHPSRWLKCVAHGRLSLERAVRGAFAFTSPVTGVQWAIASSVPITWTNHYVTGKPTTSVTIELSTNGGVSYTTFAPGRPNTNSCTVIAPSAPVPAARLRLRSDQAPNLYAESDVFTVH